MPSRIYSSTVYVSVASLSPQLDLPIFLTRCLGSIIESRGNIPHWDSLVSAIPQQQGFLGQRYVSVLVVEDLVVQLPICFLRS